MLFPLVQIHYFFRKFTKRRLYGYVTYGVGRPSNLVAGRKGKDKSSKPKKDMLLKTTLNMVQATLFLYGLLAWRIESDSWQGGGGVANYVALIWHSILCQNASNYLLLPYSSFVSMLTSCNTKPQRGVTMVASRLNGWYKAARKSVPLGTRHQIPVAYLRHAIR